MKSIVLVIIFLVLTLIVISQLGYESEMITPILKSKDKLFSDIHFVIVLRDHYFWLDIYW